MATLTISASVEGAVQSTQSVPVDDYDDASVTLALTLTLATMSAVVEGRVLYGPEYVSGLRETWESYDGTESFQFDKTRTAEGVEITDTFAYSI